MKTMATDKYAVHGMKLSVSASDAVRAGIARRLTHFERLDDSERVDVQFHFRPDLEDVAPRGDLGRPVIAEGGCLVYYLEATRDMVVELRGLARGHCNIRDGIVSISHRPETGNDASLLSRLMFTVPFSEFCKAQGRYLIHSACLSFGGRGLLIAGASGAGKSTLTLALVRGGFQFLGDDTAMLCQREGRVAALAFPDEIDLNQETANFFPELAGFPWDQPLSSRGKCPVSPARIYGIVPGRDCIPEVLIFPKASPDHRSTLAPISRNEALLELLCNVVRTDPSLAQAHLDILAAVVKQCRLHRLHTGRDFEELPALARALLSSDSPAR